MDASVLASAWQLRDWACADSTSSANTIVAQSNSARRTTMFMALDAIFSYEPYRPRLCAQFAEIRTAA
jgi:hypothetical protein